MISITPLLILLMIAIVVVIVARRLRIPYTIALVALGFAIGLIGTQTGYLVLRSSVQALFAP
ncbi:MAG: sodium:proton antiporter, partial [Thermoplasmata archaeon]|nr:sodium:proton antiporter [Thermoplasmata archaeon]